MSFNAALHPRATAGSAAGGQFTASDNAQQGITTAPTSAQAGKQAHAVMFNKQRAGTVISQSGKGAPFLAVHGDMSNPKKVSDGHPSIAHAAAAVAETHVSSKPMSQAQIELARLQLEMQGMVNPADKQRYANMIAQLKAHIANTVSAGVKIPKTIHSKPAPKPKKSKSPSKSAHPRTSAGHSGHSRTTGRSHSSHAATGHTRKGKSAKGSSGGGGSGFDPSKHPRAAKGQPGGGEFITAKSSTSGNSLNSQAAAGAQRKLGSLDAQRVRQFQKANGLQVDGTIGHQTAEALLGNRGAAQVQTGALTTAQKKKLAKL